MVTRVRRLFMMISGRAVTELEASHPLAVLDYERNHLRSQVAQYNRSLASHAALCERLRTQAARLEKEQAVLCKRVEQRLKAGDREAAARWALRLEQVQEDRRENDVQLVQAEETYKGLVRSRDVAVEAARAKIEGLKRSIGDVRVQQALADLTEMAASIQGSIGVCDGTLERVHERLEEKREYAVGRVRVAQETVGVWVPLTPSCRAGGSMRATPKSRTL